MSNMETCKILLAEDDVNLGKVLTTYLEAKGFSVMHANNGEVAYEMFCANTFGTCLVDVMMPIQDGFTLAESIRKVDSKIPIIFLTAKSMQEDILQGRSISSRHTRLHSRGSTSVPNTSRGAPFPPPSSR